MLGLSHGLFITQMRVGCVMALNVVNPSIFSSSIALCAHKLGSIALGARNLGAIALGAHELGSVTGSSNNLRRRAVPKHIQTPGDFRMSKHSGAL